MFCRVMVLQFCGPQGKAGFCRAIFCRYAFVTAAGSPVNLALSVQEPCPLRACGRGSQRHPHDRPPCACMKYSCLPVASSGHA